MKDKKFKAVNREENYAKNNAPDMKLGRHGDFGIHKGLDFHKWDIPALAAVHFTEDENISGAATYK